MDRREVSKSYRPATVQGAKCQKDWENTSRLDPDSVPVGGGGAWPGFETTREPHTSNPAPLVWRAPEGPEGTGGLRGAAPNEVRAPSLAGGRGLRRPEHPWGHQATRPRAHQAARPGD